MIDKNLNFLEILDLLINGTMPMMDFERRFLEIRCGVIAKEYSLSGKNEALLELLAGGRFRT